MPHELEYIVDQAVLMCNKGAKPNYFTATHNQTVKISGCKVCNTDDKIPITNIPEFGVCSLTQKTCMPAPTMWTNTYKVKVKGKETILFKSKLPCSIGGKIKFVTSGQVPISQSELDQITEEHAEPEDQGWGWWDTAELIPVVGNVIGMYREAKKGNWGMFALNTVFLIVDVFTFGSSSMITAPAKGAIKAGAKVAAKGAAKTGAKIGAKTITKASIKAIGKTVAKTVDDIALKTGKICVFACFPAGTLVDTANGKKAIETIQVGDSVWAWDEETGEVHLKLVTATMQKEVDATVLIELEGETIETTAEHPIYTQEGWKDAADLTTQDQIKTKDHGWLTIHAIKFLYETKKVYNFEVADWHTYFVGAWAWLVHNAKVCASSNVKLLSNFTKKIYRVGNHHILLDKKSIKHILSRHHPKYWDGSVKKFQTFFSKNTSVSDIKRGIGEVIKQNRDEILKNGTRRGQYKGIVDGVERSVGLKNGRVGQYY